MMRLPKMDYHAPESVEEAFSLLDKYGEEANILAGGTDLLPACKHRNIRPSLIVSLRKVSELKGIQFQKGEGLRIGAMTSLNDVRYDSHVLNHFPALAQAAASVGATQLQSMGTLGGNLCLNTRCIYYNQSDTWRKSLPVCFKMGGDTCHVVPKSKKCYAIFSADTVPALIALDAEVTLIGSRGERVVPVTQLYTGDGKTPVAVKTGEIISEIRIPEVGGKQRSAYLKYRVREAIDFPLVGVSARMNFNGDETCTGCRVVLNAVGSAPVDVLEASELLKGKVPTDERINELAEKAVKNAHPVANAAGATPAYRRKMAGILTRKTLRGLIQ